MLMLLPVSINSCLVWISLCCVFQVPFPFACPFLLLVWAQ